MENLNLTYDEAVIRENDQVKRGKKYQYTDKLVLTNRNLIYVEYGLFHKVKNIIKYPLNSIKKYNNQAQVTVKKSNNGYMSLIIYFDDDQEEFGFMVTRKKEPQEWADSINKLIDGVAVPMQSEKGMMENAVEIMADGLASAVGAFSTAFKKDKIRSMMCPSCSASVKGQEGSISTCPYCGSNITF